MATATNTVVGDDGVATTSQLALCVASMGGNTEIVQMLLEHGADPNTASGDPLRSAVIDGHLDIVKLLVEAGAQITPTVLQRAARGDRREICEYLDAHLNAATNGAPSAGAKAGAGQ